MASLEEQLKAAERREQEAREKAKGLRKQIRERERRQHREEERKARLAWQDAAASILRWLEANDIDRSMVPATPVNGRKLIESWMSGAVDESADTDTPMDAFSIFDVE